MTVWRVDHRPLVLTPSTHSLLLMGLMSRLDEQRKVPPRFDTLGAGRSWSEGIGVCGVDRVAAQQ